MSLMKKMVDDNEADALVAERVWQEMHKALNEQNPEVFISILRECGALERIMPELNILFGIPQPELYHPEIDTGVHTLMVLQQACQLSQDAKIRFAALCHDLGKGGTPTEKWPSHHGHEQLGVDILKQLCKRLKVPNEFRDLAIITSNFHLNIHRIFDLKPATVLKKLEQLDAFRRPERFEDFLLACLADVRGRTGFEQREYPQADFMRLALETAKNIDMQPIKEMELKGEAMARAIRKARTTAIAQLEKPEMDY